MLLVFLVFSTIFASASAQADPTQYFYILNVVSRTVLDVYEGTESANPSIVANDMKTADYDSQLWTFHGNCLFNKLSSLYLTAEGNPPNAGSHLVQADLSCPPVDALQSWTIDPIKKRLVSGDTSLCLSISDEETTGELQLPVVELSQIDYDDVTQQWEFIPPPEMG